MAMQLFNLHHDYAGGGSWITWAHAVYYDIETREETVHCTIAFGCGYLNVYPGYITWDDLCGLNPVDPQMSYEMRELEWYYDEDGKIVNSFGDEYVADYLPDEPYCFNSDELYAVSEACEALWHYHKFMVLNRP